jgi:hypothetical protein
MIYRVRRCEQDASALQQCDQQPKRSTPMFTKTMFAILAALVLTTSYVSAQTQMDRRGCVSANTEEGALSAIPAWRVC